MERNKTIAAMALAIALCALPARAEQEMTPVTYSPPPCEFSVTFPDEPYKRQECGDESKKETCVEKISYTQVYEMASTVNFRLSCNPIGAEVIENYSKEVMEATLKAMTKDTVVKTFESSSREEEGYKQAGLVGEGKSGTMPTIYIAQLWIGKKSAMSVEAEMIGEPNKEADKLFSDILKSVRYTAGDTAAAPKPEPEDAKPEAKTEPAAGEEEKKAEPEPAPVEEEAPAKPKKLND